MRLFYCPVLTDARALILRFHPHCFLNPAAYKPTPEMLMLAEIETENIIDSGGYQYFTINRDYHNGESNRRCIMMEGMGTRQIGNVKIIDPIDLCLTYGESGAKYAFTMDMPMITLSDQEFTDNLTASFELAKRMFELQPALCPDIKFIVPLQFDTKDQLHQYFQKMSILKPEGFAFPGRVYLKWHKDLKIAYILSFLHSKQVKTVHILGTSRPGVIILSALALNLGMFDQISFDSKTWHTPSTIRQLGSIDNRTLDVTPVRSFKRVQFVWPREQKSRLMRYFRSREVPFNDKLLYANVLAIDTYTLSMIELAADIGKLKKYVNTQQYLSAQRDWLLGGIDILLSAKKKGYVYIEEHLGWIWH